MSVFFIHPCRQDQSLHLIWQNGSLIQQQSAPSPSVERGIGCFETLRIQSRIPIYLSEHLRRLAASCRLLGLAEPDLLALKERLLHAASHCGGAGVLRVQLGRGLELIRVSPFVQERWARPLTLASVAPAVLDLELAQAKHCSRGHWERGAAARGVDELLWVDPQGFLLETHQGNVFAEVQGVLVTPPLDGRILAGVTRGALLAAGHAEGISLRSAPVKLARAEALWVSSSLKGLAPVKELNGVPLKSGALGGALLEALERSESA